MKKASKPFCEKMLKRRRATNMTQENLAWLCGVSRPTIANIELGEAEPSLSTALIIAKVLDIKLDKLPLGDAES